MWRTVVVLALMTAGDPVRIGITAVLVARPRPVVNLLAFWIGGMVAGIAAGIGLLVTLHDMLPNFVHRVTATISGLTAGPVQIVLGVIALLFAGRLAMRFPVTRASPIPVALPPIPQPAIGLAVGTPNVFSRASATLRRALDHGHPSVAFIVGLGSATPPVESLIALAAIVASGAGGGAQVGAIITFTVVVLAVVEIPLVSYMANPAKTEACILRLQAWMKAHRRMLSAISLTGMGVMLLTTGLGNL